MLQRGKNRVSGIIESRKNGQTEGAHQQAEWIEPADDAPAEKCGHQHDHQDVVLGGLPRLVAVRLNQILAALGVPLQVAEEVIERAHRTDPAAEEAAEEHSRDKNDEAEKQSLVKGAGGECVGNRDQRIE